MNLVGVTEATSLCDLKRSILLVDQIAVVQDPNEDWKIRKKDPATAADLDWLRDQGFVFAVNTQSAAELNVEALQQVADGISLKTKDNSRVIVARAKSGARCTISFNSEDGLSFTIGALIEALGDLLCRLECSALRMKADTEAISLHLPSPYLQELGMGNGLDSIVQRVCITSMPQPLDTVSFEEIASFKRDPEAQGRLLGLRRWMKGLSKSTTTALEAAQELEWLLHEYESYMKIQKLKYRRSVLETIVTGAGEIAENLVKLKLGKLSQMPFRIGQERLALLEAERNAPAREISFIPYARKRLTGVSK